jgi:Domain of unknown function (DUF4169)
MAEVINLRLARKARATEAAALAAENRVRHGQSTSERRQRQAEDLRAAHNLAGHLRDKP